MSGNFNPENESFDVAWLKANGWTLPGNLAYRHTLHDWNRGGQISQERIEQIIMQYNAQNQSAKIQEALNELIKWKQILQDR
ncbi:MAG TPA: hypothetical protein V6C63_17740 [Allocoleopsis sp.]